MQCKVPFKILIIYGMNGSDHEPNGKSSPKSARSVYVF